MTTEFIFDPSHFARIGRIPLGAAAMTNAQRQKKHKAKEKEKRLENIAILDMESDPFDAKNKATVFPFLAVLYSDNFDPIIIWENNRELFVEKLIAAIESLPDQYTIFAHNGGKFDYMFLLHKLRGFVSFKGRGLMSAKIGRHTLRDSFHIIPEKLATYKKDDFDYRKLLKHRRHKHRDEIIEYCVNDCKYLLDIVQSFIREHGLKLSIGQAAMVALKEAGYTYERLTAHTDAYIRKYFYGGRVECLAGKGHFVGNYKLYDVNSMYPFVMAERAHPIGKDYIIRAGKPNRHTVFIDLQCDNYGALVTRTPDGETSASQESGRFFTTIWEYETALKYGLIENVKIKFCIDCHKRTTFENFVVPNYNKRQTTKAVLKTLDPESREYLEVKKDDIFTKLLLNNAYGKFATNPRRYKESYITALGEKPPESEEGFSELPIIENEELGYAIWERPQKRQTFFNVGTAASITGAARAVLMEAICNSDDPIYCDTDSVICRNLRDSVIDPVSLGAWDIEEEYSEFIVAGKKLYAGKRNEYYTAKNKGKEYKFRSKGTQIENWQDMLRLLEGEIVEVLNKGPTLTKAGKQSYISRKVRATAKPQNMRLSSKLQRRA